jgi:hypothetical protein
MKRTFLLLCWLIVGGKSIGIGGDWTYSTSYFMSKNIATF